VKTKMKEKVRSYRNRQGVLAEKCNYLHIYLNSNQKR
jgi:hypothetical protein